METLDASESNQAKSPQNLGSCIWFASYEGPISNHSQIARCCENVDTQKNVLATDGTCCTSLLLDIFVHGLFSQGHVRLNEGEFISDMKLQNA